MIIDGLEWDDENIEHINRHYIHPEEIEDVCFGIHVAYRGRFNRYILYGQTERGRYLKVIVEHIYGKRFRPVTAFAMSKSEQHNYRRRI